MCGCLSACSFACLRVLKYVCVFACVLLCLCAGCLCVDASVRSCVRAFVVRMLVCVSVFWCV